MATEVALAAEENGKIVSAVYPKSYLPSHGVCYETSNCILCIFADAIRTGYAEAKPQVLNVPCVLIDAIRTGYAEAKLGIVAVRIHAQDAIRTGYAEAKALENSQLVHGEKMQSAQDMPRQRQAQNPAWQAVWMQSAQDTQRKSFSAQCPHSNLLR